MSEEGVYILKSQKNNRYYIGSTNNLSRRLNQHKLGQVMSTRLLRPLEFVAFIKCLDLADARRAEYRLKKYKRKDILEKTIKDGIFPWNH
jgi:putative endonuclease